MTVDCTVGMVYYNNLLSLPICLPIAWLMGEFPAVLDAPLLHGPEANSFMLCALFSGVMGFVLNLASLWCNQSVTATVCITYMLYVICYMLCMLEHAYAHALLLYYVALTEPAKHHHRVLATVAIF
jgi:hypothetical protein